MDKRGAAEAVIEAIFEQHYPREGVPFRFERQELVEQGRRLGVKVLKNLGDVIYGYRSRHDLPLSIRETAPKGWEWVIRPAGKGVYEFGLARFCFVEPRAGLQAMGAVSGLMTGPVGQTHGVRP